MPNHIFHKVKKHALPALFITGFFSSFPALAQTVEQLPGIIVEAAGLQPIEADKVGSAVSIVTAKEIEAAQYRYVPDVLRSMPGIHVSRTGSFGGITQVRMRGAEGNHVLVLIDGVDVSAAGTGEFDFSNLLAGDIERIEVLRGPQSGLYGSNALAGVINIITKKGKGPLSILMSAEAGSFTTDAQNISVSGGNATTHGRFSFSRRRSSGFNIAADGNEKDGSTHHSFMFKGGVLILPNASVDSVLRYQNKKTEDDPQDFAFPFTPTYGTFVDGIGETQIEEFYAKTDLKINLLEGRWLHKFTGSFKESQQNGLFLDSFAGPTTSFNDGSRSRFAYQTTYNFDFASLAAKNSMTALYEVEKETFVSNGSNGKKSRVLNGYVVEYQGNYFDRLMVQANLRHDQNDGFKDATTYRLAGAFLIPQTYSRIHASYGTAITNPTFFEQFGSGANFIANPSLIPEESRGWDIGLEQKFFGNALTVDVTYFKADLENEIRSVFGFPNSTVENLTGKSKREGVEVSGSLQIMKNLVFTGAYTYTKSTDPDGLEEVRRPEHSAKFSANYAFLQNKAKLGVTVAYNGEMKDLRFLPSFVAPFSEQVVLQDYTLVRLTGSYQITDTVEVYGRVENLFDEQYQEIFTSQTAGLAAYGGVRIKLQAENNITGDQ